MFYIIIGQSGAGKTTFAKKNFLTASVEVKQDIIPYSECENGIIALGKYDIGKRTEGTDTLPYNALSKIKQQIKKFKGKDVLLEGDRINNREVFDYIIRLGIEAQLFLVVCSLETSMKRLRAAGSTITPKFVKTTKTKSRRIFLEYCQKFNGKVINTDAGGANGNKDLQD